MITGKLQASIILLVVGIGIHHTSQAQESSGFFEGLGNSFKQMGSDLKGVVQGRSQGESNQTQVEDGNVNASEPSLGAEAQDRQLIKEIQYRLSALGYLPGSVDGMMSKQTAFAIRKYQRTSGIAVDGMPSAQLLALLRSVTSDLKIPADIASTQSPNPGIASSIGSAFNKVTGSISNALGTSNTNALVEVAKQTALAVGLNQAAMSGVPMEAITAAAGLGQAPTSPSPMQNVQAKANLPLSMGKASSGSSQSYLDRMVAESDAMVYQRAQNISPYDREMARRSGIDVDRLVAQQLEGYEKYKRDAAEINRLTTVQAAPATRTSSPSSSQPLPSVLAGRWEGKVTYNPKDISPTLPGRSGQQTRVRLDVDPYRGLLAVTYPDLGCQGILRANSSVPSNAGVNQHELNDYPLNETLATGKNCTDGGTVYLTHLSAYQPGPTAKKGQLMFKWANPTTKKPAMFGRLLPVSDVIDKKAIDEIASKADKNIVANTTRLTCHRSENEVAEKFANKGVTENEVGLLVKATPYALLSANVYYENFNKGDVVYGWKIIDQEKKSLFYARAYVRANEVVIAFKGTDGLTDWVITNIIGSIIGAPADVYSFDFVRKIITTCQECRGKRIIVTGHSKGGRLAQVALLKYRAISKAYTFNSAPISLLHGIYSVTVPEELGRATQNTLAIRETGDYLELVAGWNVGEYVEVNFVYNVETLTGLPDPFLYGDDKGSHEIETLANGIRSVAEYYYGGSVKPAHCVPAPPWVSWWLSGLSHAGT